MNDRFNAFAQGSFEAFVPSAPLQALVPRNFMPANFGEETFKIIVTIAAVFCSNPFRNRTGRNSWIEQ